MRAYLAALILLPLFLLAACLSPSSPGRCASDDEATLAYATASCDRLARCDPPALSMQYGDIATCVARRRLHCQGFYAPDSLTTQDDVMRCADALRTASCVPGGDPPACRPKPGARPDGDPCIANSQCAGTFCSPPGRDGCGACRSLPTLGQACNFSCGFGLACASGSRRCVQPVLIGAGEACSLFDGTRLCQEGLVCAEGQCRAPAQQGEPCSGWETACDPRQQLFCMGLTCEPLTATINSCRGDHAPRLCGSASDCVHCGSTNWSCHPRVPDGEACGTCGVERGLCFEPAVCINKRCVLRDPGSCG